MLRYSVGVGVGFLRGVLCQTAFHTIPLHHTIDGDAVDLDASAARYPSQTSTIPYQPQGTGEVLFYGLSHSLFSSPTYLGVYVEVRHFKFYFILMQLQKGVGRLR